MTGSELAELLGNRLKELLEQNRRAATMPSWTTSSGAWRRLICCGATRSGTARHFAYQAITTNPRIPDYLNLHPVNPESAETAEELIDNLASQWRGE